MNCPECGYDHQLAQLSVGVIGGSVIVGINDAGFPLPPHEARELAEVLVQAADLAQWAQEVQG